ncbi:MAG TPA: indole-3-glycerol-phosphate synthase [Polyangiaceae bacterium]|jgi:indole-3-glycerol phosphate synthase|nr:indole-3-glycerol-phosphate synthase [Polyangiaceae bacterium]
MAWLRKILDHKQTEIARLRALPLPAPPALRPLALRRTAGQPLRLIAEIKLRSPSAGPLSTLLSVSERARCYERAGASMVSVLCDARFFDGAFEHLEQARSACSLPILCKDFVIDEVQLDAARAFGADAVLLIVRCLSEERLPLLVSAARERGLEPFVEVTTHEESRRALHAGAALVGVNARDLDGLQMDPAQAAEVLSALPKTLVRARFSGLGTPEAVRALAESDADAALVGEALMRRSDPEPFLKELAAAAGS